MLAVVFLYLCFTATMFLGSLILTANHYPYFVAGARFFASGIILLSMYAVRHRKSIREQLPQLWCVPFFKYAFCLYTLSAVGFSWGMQYVDPIKACFVFVLAPFITALLLYFLKNEQLTRKKTIGLIVGFSAVIPIILESAHENASSSELNMAMLGYLVFGCAVVSFAYGWILNKEMHGVVHAPSSLVTGVALVVGGGTTLLGCIVVQGRSLFEMQVTEDFWWLLLLFAILTAGAYNLYSSLLKRFSATFVSFASFLEPAFGLMYAAIFLGQKVSTVSLFSLTVLGCGLYLFYQEELRLQ
ncbi:DMT family transporter [Candidatus Babeliales bacterium]|nr:DMT family transporter [Candidatus Babeliales bacterium]MBP9844091.1 DMT family transporter [Candidatus Babeliales bacterium]